MQITELECFLCPARPKFHVDPDDGGPGKLACTRHLSAAVSGKPQTMTDVANEVEQQIKDAPRDRIVGPDGGSLTRAAGDDDTGFDGVASQSEPPARG
jgi:hypothetical protein